MSRRRPRSRFHEPSLVPLADMLTNTVGIMVFILIFTVLTAGGVVVAKRLPLEHATQAKPVYCLCAGGRLIPMTQSALIDQFVDPLGRPTSYYAVDGWVKKFNAQRIEHEDFIVTGEGKANFVDLGFYKSASMSLAVIFTPREGRGETIAELRLETARFRQVLSQHDNRERFIYFLVRPDSLEVFDAARAIAIDEKQFTTGWGPLDIKDPVRFSISGGGRSATVQ